uniref:YLP motif-containing protein 1 n=1 Tax=Macrostomum lignano TaxID=282301 RepID=A0A1I8HB61_9PLAT
IQNKPYQQHYEQQERYAQHRPQQHAQYEQYQQHYEHHDRYPQGNSEHELQEQYDQQYQHYDDQYRQHQTGQQQFQQHHAGQHQFQQQHPGQPRFQQQHAEQKFQQHGLGQQHHVDQQHYQKRPTLQGSFQLSQQQQEHLYQRHQEENKSSVEHSDNQYQNLDQPQEHNQQQSELWNPRQEERQIPYGIQPVPKQQGLPYGIVQLEREKREEPHRGYQNFQQAQVTQQQRSFSNFQPPQQNERHQSYHQPNQSRQPPQRQDWQSQGRPYQAQGFAGPSRQSQPVPLMQHQISKPDQQPAVQPLMQIQQLQSPQQQHPPPSQQQSKPKPLFASAAARSLKEASQPALEPPVDLLSLLCQPGRQSRPHNLCILLRGLPGAGKSRLARLIKEKEMQQGGQPPRILSIDDYFTMDGRYEYDAEAEPMYRASLLKAFSKQLETGLFPFIIVDCPLETLDQLTPFISAASRCGYSPFALDVSGASPAVCAQRGIHGRSLAEVEAVAQFWQPLPMTTSVGGCGYRRLDASSLLQESDITLVEMDEADASDAEAGDSGKAGNAEVNNEEDAEPDAVAGDGRLFVPSKWESEADRDAQLERLDGLRHQQGAQSQQQKATSARELLMEYMSMPAAGKDSGAAAGRKRVRWADLEELREQAKRKRLGFVACGTDWDKLMSDDSVVADQALNRTKFF